MKIPCCINEQNGEVVCNMFLYPDQLRELVAIDWVEERSLEDFNLEENGYQRHRNKKDIKKFSNFIMGEDALMPNGIWLNDREHTVIITKKKGSSFATIKTNKKSKLYCPDGQARVLGIIEAQELLSAGGDDSLDEYPIPVTMTQVSKNEEMRGFVDINDNAKTVKAIEKAWVNYRLGVAKGINVFDKDEDLLSAISVGVLLRLDSKQESPFYDAFLDTPTKPGIYYISDIKADPSRSDKRSIKGSTFFNAMLWRGKLITHLNKKYSDKEFEARIISITDEIMDFWRAVKKKTYNSLWIHKQYYAFWGAVGLRAMCLVHYKLLVNYKNPSKIIEKHLLNVSYFQDTIKWVGKGGKKPLRILKKDEYKTLIDKRGPSIGDSIGADIFDEIVEDMQRKKATRKRAAKKR